MNHYSISRIHAQFMTHFKVNHGFIFIGYYKSHGVVIRVILRIGNRKIIWVGIINIYID